jgi:hypothetical protein
MEQKETELSRGKEQAVMQDQWQPHPTPKVTLELEYPLRVVLSFIQMVRLYKLLLITH